jgi:hypothetical protein
MRSAESQEQSRCARDRVHAARAVFDQADAARELVAIERARMALEHF